MSIQSRLGQPQFGAIYQIVQNYPEAEGKRLYKQTRDAVRDWDTMSEDQRKAHHDATTAAMLARYKSLEPLKQTLAARGIPVQIVSTSVLAGTIEDTHEKRVEKDYLTVATTQNDVDRIQRFLQIDKELWTPSQEGADAYNDMLSDINKRITAGVYPWQTHPEDTDELHDGNVLRALQEDRFDAVNGRFIGSGAEPDTQQQATGWRYWLRFLGIH